jgi:hypothetical protein
MTLSLPLQEPEDRNAGGFQPQEPRLLSPESRFRSRRPFRPVYGFKKTGRAGLGVVFRSYDPARLSLAQKEAAANLVAGSRVSACRGG